MKPEERKVVIVIVTIVVVIVLVTSLILMLTLLPVKQVNVERSDSVEHLQDVDSLDLNVSANRMTLEISYEAMEDRLVQFDLRISGGAPLLSSTDVLEEYAFDQSLDQGNLSLNIEVKVKEGALGISNLKVTGELLIHPSLTSSIGAESKVGGINLISADGVVFESIFIGVEVGKASLHLTEGTTIRGDVNMRTSTGSIDFEWDNAEAMEDASIDLQTGTGSVDIIIVQSGSLHSDVDLDVRTGTGGISLQVYIEDNVGARIVSSTGVGSIDIERAAGFVMTTSSLIESDNYPTSSDFRFALEAGVGGIKIDAEYRP